MTKTQNTFEQHLRLAASYTSKEAADHEEPEIDLARIPSDDHHRMGDGDLHAVQVISWALFVLFDFLKFHIIGRTPACWKVQRAL